MIEVELKFALPTSSRALLEARLAALPAMRSLAAIQNVDIYYDTPDFACLRQAVFIRIRDHARLEVKYHEQDDPTHTHAIERVFSLYEEGPGVQGLNELCSRFLPHWHDAQTVEAALTANYLAPFVRIEKQRTRYVDEELRLDVDQVNGLGDFLEIEMLCTQETEVEQAHARLLSFVSELALPGLLPPVRIGYVELWLRSHLPHVYRLGKYQAEEDALPIPAFEAAVSTPEHS